MSELSPSQSSNTDLILSPLHKSQGFSIPCLFQASPLGGWPALVSEFLLSCPPKPISKDSAQFLFQWTFRALLPTLLGLPFSPFASACGHLTNCIDDDRLPMCQFLSLQLWTSRKQRSCIIAAKVPAPNGVHGAKGASVTSVWEEGKKKKRTGRRTKGKKEKMKGKRKNLKKTV